MVATLLSIALLITGALAGALALGLLTGGEKTLKDMIAEEFE